MQPVGRKWVFFFHVQYFCLSWNKVFKSLFFFSFLDWLSSQTTSFPQNVAFGQALQLDIQKYLRKYSETHHPFLSLSSQLVLLAYLLISCILTQVPPTRLSPLPTLEALCSQQEVTMVQHPQKLIWNPAIKSTTNSSLMCSPPSLHERAAGHATGSHRAQHVEYHGVSFVCVCSASSLFQQPQWAEQSVGRKGKRLRKMRCSLSRHNNLSDR